MKKTKAKTKTKIKKFSIIFIVLIVVMSASAFLYASSVIEDPIEISVEDANLYEAIIDEFEEDGMKHYEDAATLTITASEAELSQVTELNLQGKDGSKISDITGLEVFEMLETINLANNNITDIAPISELTQLTSINLNNNSNVNLYNKNDGTCYLPNQSNLEKLYISSTNNSDISFVSNLPNLRELNVSNNGISILTQLRTLNNLEVLDVSNNAAITTIDDILPITTLKELNIATTGITNLLHSDYEYDVYEYGIFVLTNLESLNVENNKLSIEPIYKTYYIESTGTTLPYLSKLEKLNFNYTGQSYVDYWSLSQLTSLTHLYMKGNEIYYVGEDIATLPNLEYINLAENNIEDISGFIKYDSEGNIAYRLKAKQIILEHNRIENIEPLGNLGHDIDYLDLSSNVVFYIDAIEKYTFSLGLDLTRQGRDKYDYEGNEEIYYWSIKDKKAEVNQYIFLPPLFQNSKSSESKVYAENINFSMENISLNPDTNYHVPGYYNVIIKPPVDEDGDGIADEKVLSITLNGGCANGSKLHFKIEDNYDSMDSLLFRDENLANAIEDDLIPKALKYDLYVKSELDLLNITYSLIGDTDTLHLENKDIQYLDGLSSFENLSYLYLSNNNISSIDEIKTCEYMTELYVSNNPNIGNNNSAIENMKYLTKLDLSTTGMTNIESLQNLIEKWKLDGYYTLTSLNISNNGVGNIQNIGLISSLESLDISSIGIEDISELSTLKNLQTLNVSKNQIENIKPLQGLNKLRYLTISNNKIEDITPISTIALDSLDFSNNMVKDISSLTNGYSTIIMDTNQISDISNFDGKIINNFSVANQRISYEVDDVVDENITIPLPNIFIDAKTSGSKVYTEETFYLDNCDLSSDGSSVIVNPTTLGEGIAIVRIQDGNADDTTFSIAAPLTGIISYSTEELTNQNVTATIRFNRNNVSITNNNGSNTYTFEQNGTFEFKYMDENGFEGTAIAEVNNIDKDAPTFEVSKTIVDKEIVVTITANEEITEIEGWTLSEDKKSITKTYTQTVSETINIVDLAGNITEVDIEVMIDITAPVISGVENGQTYNDAVTPTVQDASEVAVTLTKDGTIVNNYQIGTPIEEAGEYVLTVTDTFGNTTTVSFKIEVTEISDIITSEEVTVTEEERVISDIQPKTTLQELKQQLEYEMEFKILDEEGNELSETASIGTGYQIKMENDKVYTLIVIGDCNGDGKADKKDILQINKHRLNKALLMEAYLQAGDVDGNGKADKKDILQINKFRLGKINEL